MPKRIKKQSKLIGLLSILIGLIIGSIISPPIQSASAAKTSEFIVEYHITQQVFTGGEAQLRFQELNLSEYDIYVYWEIEHKTGEVILNGNAPRQIVNQDHNEYHFTFDLPIPIIPGDYNLSLYLFSFNATLDSFQLSVREDFTLNILFGPLLTWSFMLIFLFGLISIFLQKEVLITIPQASNTAGKALVEYFSGKNDSPRSAGHNPRRKEAEPVYQFIQCPDCKKPIIEGSAFCPHCGYHLRKFERYMI